jgi:hypothetical protein
VNILPQYSGLIAGITKWKLSLISVLIKTGILVIAFFYLIEKLAAIRLEVVSELWFGLFQSSHAIVTIITVLLLMPLNWALEAKKWQLLSAQFEQVTFWNAFKGVLSGLSLAFITPHALGDYAGKVGHLKSEHKWYALGPVFIGRIGQLTVTLYFGIAGAGYLLEWTWLNILMVMILFKAIVLLVFVSRKYWKVRIQTQNPFIRPLLAISGADLAGVLAYALMRYLVFSFQFLLVMDLFEIPVAIPVQFLGVTWIFLMKSVLPSFNFLSDLGIRECSAILFFSSIGVPELQVVSASLMIWLVNLLLPTLIGMVFVLRMKLFS